MQKLTAYIQLQGSIAETSSTKIVLIFHKIPASTCKVAYSLKIQSFSHYGCFLQYKSNCCALALSLVTGSTLKLFYLDHTCDIVSFHYIPAFNIKFIFLSSPLLLLLTLKEVQMNLSENQEQLHTFRFSLVIPANIYKR